MDYFPLFCQMKDRQVLVVGGGEVAERKLRLLLQAGARIRLVGRELAPEVANWVTEGRLNWQAQEFDEHQLAGCWLTIAATDDPQLNERILAACNARQIWCNAVDDPDNASAILPAIIDRSPLLVAISSAGQAPVLARLLREQLEANLPQKLGELARLAGRLRTRVKQRFATLKARRRFWERFMVHPPLLAAFEQGGDAEAIADALLAEDDSAALAGSVTLVGAGPGDPGLLTLKALQVIQSAEAVVYDKLVSDEVMNLVRRDADRHFVGKQRGFHSLPQEEINALLIHLARQGLRVVRLKGGDPFIFGRGGEEVEALQQAGIPVNVVPGVTAAIGCAAATRLPLTHRGVAQSVRFITATHKPGDPEPDWSHFRPGPETLVFYMGLSLRERISRLLLAQGFAPQLPVALISCGTTPQQQVRHTTLAELPQVGDDLPSPTLVIVGESSGLPMVE